MIVLESALSRNPSSAKANYYLGNLYYDKRRQDDAIRCWSRSSELDSTFCICWRNLGIAEFNVRHNPEAAERMYECAFRTNPADARLLYEWDQLKKRAALATPEERLPFLSQHPHLVSCRDDLTVEYTTLLNHCGRHEEALEILGRRRFSPWEGGEGMVSGQYVQAHRALGKADLAAGNAHDALKHFESARRYPENLGEGKHLLTLECDLDYLSGVAARKLGQTDSALRYWNSAAADLLAPGIHSYFQALAFNALGRKEEADRVISELARFAADQIDTPPRLDYFATSLPNLLLFDDDLEKRNRIESTVLAALASHAGGDRVKAIGLLKRVIAEDPNHLFAEEAIRWIGQEEK